jgi:biopolymer transport protein ExbB
MDTIMKPIRTILLLTVFAGQAGLFAAEPSSKQDFTQAAQSVQQQLEQSLAELTQLREQIASEKLPLSQQLSNLENELISVRQEFQQTSRLLDSRTLDLGNLRSEINSRKQEAAYLSNLLGEYIRNFESRLHIAEIQRYRQPLDEAKLAAENTGLSEEQIYQEQAKLLSVSLDHLDDAAGGTIFEGTAVDATGLVNRGTFLMLGPAALFASADGQNVGTAEQRLGSLEAAIVGFGDPVNAAQAAELIRQGSGTFPLDPTLGSAHKIEQIKETVWDEFRKGGPVMYPIFILAGAALLVALLKLLFISLTWVRTPSQQNLQQLFKAVASHDEKAVAERVKKLYGHVGTMLKAGVEHIREPRELIEEIMYEKVMAARLKLDRFLPFVAVSAASAPLLGLLGTVTGIINTFALITVFGSGDVKSLSGGISEALITTKYGLIVAIPSLLIHAFLSRMSRSIVNKMEGAAVGLVNQISKTPYRVEQTPDLKLDRQQFTRLLEELSVNPSVLLRSSGPAAQPQHNHNSKPEAELIHSGGEKTGSNGDGKKK